MDRGGRIPRTLTAAAALASLAHVGVLIPRYILTDDAVPLSIRLFVGCIVFTVLAAIGGSVLALILVVRSWRRPEARPLALFLAAAAALWGSVLRLLDVSAAARDLSISINASTVPLLVLSVTVVVAAASFLRLSALFPAPLDPGVLPPPRRLHALRRARVALLRARTVWLSAALALLAIMAYTMGGGPVLAFIFAGTFDFESVITRPENVALLRVWGGGMAVLAAVTVVLMPAIAMILGVRNLVAGYRAAAHDERRRVLWIVAGSSIAAWMILAPLLAAPVTMLTSLSADWLPFVGGLLLAFAPAVLVCTAAVAIFYSGAVDPALVLKRSTVFGILGAAGFVLFTALESVVSEFFEATLGLPGVVGSVAAGCIAAALMIPVRRALSLRSRRAPSAQRSTAIVEQPGVDA